VTSYIEQNNLKVVPVQQAPPEPVVSQPVVTTQKTTSTQSQHDADYEDLEITNIRKVIAKRLLFSKVKIENLLNIKLKVSQTTIFCKTTIPHSYVSSTCVIDKVVELRKQMIKENKKVSINDFIIKALALSLRVGIRNKHI
jgi:pyruvate/2-oxoglutarate dehydrogenase complex dihydrolipoamide acyltransferase (E2) component